MWVRVRVWMRVDLDSVKLMWTFVGCEDGRTGGDILSGLDDL